jgi:hypothetical protein
MSFKNLQQRFEENVNKLYQGSQLKFDGGKPSTGANDDPLIVRKPGNGYWIRTEGRSTPVSSTIQDVKRVTLFTASVRGVLFLAKQQLLQTGNTFADTRLINPAFAIANAVPFLHIRRGLRPITGPFGIFTSRDSVYANIRQRGQLQKETYDSFNALNSSKVGKFFKRLTSPITNTISAFTAEANVGSLGWDKSRPELGKDAASYIVSARNRLDTRFPMGGILKRANFYGAQPSGNIKYFSKLENKKTNSSSENSNTGNDYNLRLSQILPTAARTSEPIRVNTIERDLPRSLYNLSEVPVITEKEKTDYQKDTDKFFVDFTPDITSQPFIKYFTAGDGSLTSRTATNARDVAEPIRTAGNRIKYTKDPLNTAPAAPGNILPFYKDDLATVQSNTTGKNDAITVSFAMGKNEHVQFRAFITGLQQTASPQYKTYQYIGRIEKFVSYSTVERQVSFKLGIIAFSKDELEIVWKRINYMTGLVFPYGYNKGILQPNIVRMTIGNIYSDQPCYITSLNTSFTELSETWDIDSEVPISALLSISANLIEKDTKTANSPFYGITEPTSA